MNNKIIKGSYKKHKSIKNKNVDKGLLLMQCFSFDYAGKASIFITYKHSKYQLVISGVHIIEDVYCFAPHYIQRYNFEKLYTAIKAFNLVVSILCNSMDWYNEEAFSYSNIYDEIFFED